MWSVREAVEGFGFEFLAGTFGVARVTRPDDLFNVPGVQLYLQDPHPRNADFAIKYTKLKAHGMRILIQPSDALQ